MPVSFKVKTEWDREERSLQFVAATALFCDARARRVNTSSGEVTVTRKLESSKLNYR